MIVNKLCTYYFDEQIWHWGIIPKLLKQYMKSSVWKEILEIDFRSLKTYQSFLWLLDASKAPGDQHCFMEQCQSKENNQKIYIYNENLRRWCPKMCQEMYFILISSKMKMIYWWLHCVPITTKLFFPALNFYTFICIWQTFWLLYSCIHFKSSTKRRSQEFNSLVCLSRSRL